MLKRKEDRLTEVPENIKKAKIEKIPIKLLLIINDHHIEWLAPISEALTQKLRRQIVTWNLEVKALNHELAFEYGLIKG